MTLMLEKLKAGLLVFTQIELDTSPKIQIFLEHISPSPHGYCSNSENIYSQPLTHFSSLDFDYNDEFSSVIKGTLQVNYAHTDYLSSYNPMHHH